MSSHEYHEIRAPSSAARKVCAVFGFLTGGIVALIAWLTEGDTAAVVVGIVVVVIGLGSLAGGQTEDEQEPQEKGRPD